MKSGGALSRFVDITGMLNPLSVVSASLATRNATLECATLAADGSGPHTEHLILISTLYQDGSTVCT